MPEELIIVLAVLVGAIWLLAKIIQAIAAAFDDVSKSYSQAAARRKRNHYFKRRDDVREFVHAVIPDELDGFEKKLNVTRIDFERTQMVTNWVARPPAWRKEEFQSAAPPRKNSHYREMCTDDIDVILSPNSDSSTWSANESDITSRQCKYPFVPPAAKPEKFTAFPTLSPDLKAAVFEVDAARISGKDVARYFSDEQSKVLTYNNRRADLIAKTASLNSAIEEWNKESRTSWERYVAESKRMEDAELLGFQRASDVYTKACREEKNYFKRLLEGYKKGEKQSVLERLEYVLDNAKLPGSVPHTWDIDFDEEQRIVVIEIGLPDVVHQTPLKTVILKSGAVKKPLNQTERKELVPKIHPAILLRTAYEVFRNDAAETIALLVLNGWVKFDDPATGTNTRHTQLPSWSQEIRSRC